MNTSTRFCSVVSGLALVAAFLAAPVYADYTPNFDDDPPFGDPYAGFTLTGQDGWTSSLVGGNPTPTPEELATDVTQLSILPSYSTLGNLNWAQFGGLIPFSYNFDPVAISTTIWRPFISPDEGKNLRFDVRMAVTSSDELQPSRDTFSWIIGADESTPIFSAVFVPDTFESQNVLRVTFRDYNNVLIPTEGDFYIGYDAIYRLVIDLTALDTATPHAQVWLTTQSNITTEVLDVDLPDATPDGPTQVAANWTLTDTTEDEGEYPNYGSNTLVFDNYSATVPEPTTTLLIALAGVGLLAQRARRRAARI